MSDVDRADPVVRARRRWVQRSTREQKRWRRGRVRPKSVLAERPLASRILHRVGGASSHAAAGVVAATAVVAWVIVGGIVDFTGWWLTVLDSASASVTLVMVFAIQHTQSRQQSATQRKLDELLRAQPTADNGLIAVEEAPDEELEALAVLNIADRHQAAADPDS